LSKHWTCKKHRTGGNTEGGCGLCAAESEIYIVITEGRYWNVDVEAFTNKQEAIYYARSKAKEPGRLEGYYGEKNVKGWEYYACCSRGNIYIGVRKKILKGATNG